MDKMNQMNPLNQQQNRYLESPYVIRCTCPNEQFLFGTINNFEEGNVFRKNGFLMPLYNVAKQIGGEVENNDEVETKKNKCSK